MIIVLLFAVILFWQTRPRYYSSQWFRTRMLLYVGLCAYGVVPALHWISLNGGFESQVVQVKISVIYMVPGGIFSMGEKPTL